MLSNSWIYYLAPKISTVPENEAMAYRVNFTRGKARLITKAGGPPPEARVMEGSSPLTHSLFGRYSPSLSFPLVSPGKKEERQSFRLYCLLVGSTWGWEQWESATVWDLEWGMRVKLLKVKLAQLLKESIGQNRRASLSGEDLKQTGLNPT